MTVVVTSRFFGPDPKGQTTARMSFASLEAPEESLWLSAIGRHPAPG